MRFRRLLSGVALVLMAACDRSPAEPFARLVERAASWAATAHYVDELYSSGQVPATYRHEVYIAGADGLAAVRSKLAKDKKIDPHLASEATDRCDELASLFARAADSDAPPARSELERLNAALLAVAARARGQTEGP